MTELSRRELLGASLAAAAICLPIHSTAVAARANWTVPAAAIPASPAGAQLGWTLDQVNTAAERLTERELKRHFVATFLDALPAKDLLGVFRGYLAPNGPMALARFEGSTDGPRIRAILTTPSADWRVTLGIDPDEPQRIDELFFEPVALPAPLLKTINSWNPLQRRLAAIAPDVSFFAAEIVDGQLDPLYRVTRDRTLSIASSFKLYVLAELARQVDAGLAAWDEPLAIRDDLRSLPNGDMRLEPDGTEFALRYFAERMISASDNTATDHLIARLGRENVEAAFAACDHAHPERNTPLLLTREWFAMKLRLIPAEIESYLASDVDAKRAYLADRVDLEAATLSELEQWPGPYYNDEIEWFASATDLCTVMAHLHSLSGGDGFSPIHDALSLNPGIAFDARTWAFVGYKGGYETGVKSDVWLLQRGDGRWFTLAAIINDPKREIDGYGLWQLMMPAVELLANHD
jgi:beta-lactamase class A